MKKTKLVLALLASGLMMNFTAHAASVTTSFTVRANIAAPCTVTADDMDFGTVNLDNSNETNSNIYVNCPVGVNAYVTIGTGLSYDTSEDSRRLSQTIGGVDNFIQYSLYADNARTVPFRTFMSSGYGGVGITGTGLDETVPVYGYIPVQTSKPAGTYTDLVNVQVDY